MPSCRPPASRIPSALAAGPPSITPLPRGPIYIIRSPTPAYISLGSVPNLPLQLPLPHIHHWHHSYHWPTMPAPLMVPAVIHALGPQIAFGPVGGTQPLGIYVLDMCIWWPWYIIAIHLRCHTASPYRPCLVHARYTYSSCLPLTLARASVYIIAIRARAAYIMCDCAPLQ